MTGECSTARADFHNALGMGLRSGGGDLLQDGIGGKEMLTELARQASSVKQ